MSHKTAPLQVGMLVATCGAVRFTIVIAALGLALADVAFAAPEEQSCSYLLTPLTIGVSGAGGTGQITVTTGASCSWSAAAGSAWLSVSPNSGVGNGTVTWVAAPNPLSTQRFGGMTIAGRTVFVSQTQRTSASSAPGAPRQLAASVSGSNVTLTWSAPDSGGAPSSYVLDVGSASGSSNIASFATGNTLTTFSANNAPSGVYFARVRAQNAAGTSAASNEVTFTVSPLSCAVMPPSSLQSTVDGSLVTLSWAAPAGGAAPISYALEVGTSALLTNVGVFYTGSPGTSFSANAPAGTYFVRVRAVTQCGVTAPTADVMVVVQP